MVTDLTTLDMLGRRVERILYFGIFLLFLCALEVYLSSAYLAFQKDDSITFDILTSQLNEQLPQLQALFDEKIEVPGVATREPPPKPLSIDEQHRNAADAQIRRQLGLPPVAPARPTPKPPAPPTYERSDSYPQAIRRIAIDVAYDQHIGVNTVLSEVDTSLNPQDLIKKLQERSTTLRKQSVVVWGIETPRQIAMNYFGVDYRVPSSFLASALGIALYLLSVGWYGSLYVTRQRELYAISALHDFGKAFPHILNLFSVQWRGSMFAGKAKRAANSAEALNRGMLLLVRIVIIVVFSIPMFLSGCYAAYAIASTISDFSIWWILAGVICIPLPFVQIIGLCIQEWYLVRGKQFYA